jgi:hypothetical protein
VKVLGILAALLSGLLALSCAAAKEPLAIKCTKSSLCSVVDADSGKVLLGDLPATPTVQPLGAKLLEIKASCGSPCSASAFYERSGRKMSELFADVILAAPDIGQVIYAKDGKLVYSPMFGKPRATPLKTKQPLAETASVVSAVVSAAFVKPSSVKLTYLSGEEFKEVTEVIALVPAS